MEYDFVRKMDPKEISACMRAKFAYYNSLVDAMVSTEQTPYYNNAIQALESTKTIHELAIIRKIFPEETKECMSDLLKRV